MLGENADLLGRELPRPKAHRQPEGRNGTRRRRCHSHPQEVWPAARMTPANQLTHSPHSSKCRLVFSIAKNETFWTGVRALKASDMHTNGISVVLDLDVPARASIVALDSIPVRMQF